MSRSKEKMPKQFMQQAPGHILCFLLLLILMYFRDYTLWKTGLKLNLMVCEQGNHSVLWYETSLPQVSYVVS